MRQETLSEETLRRATATRFDFEQLVVVPVLAVVVAMALGGIVMLLTGVNIPTIGKAYGALFSGSFGSVSALSETLHGGGAGDAGRARRGARLPCRAVQHRRRRPGDRRRHGGGGGRLLVRRPACLHPSAAGAACRHRGRRHLGGDPRLAEGGDRGARGHHHDHAQPDRGAAHQLSAAQSADPEAGPPRPDLLLGSAQRGTAQALDLARPESEAQRRHHHHHPHGDPGLLAAVPHDARLRVPRQRPQPVRGALCRHALRA